MLLQTSLGIDECRRRLHKALGDQVSEPWWQRLLGYLRVGVVGALRADDHLFVFRRNVYWRNSFSPVFRGRLIQDSGHIGAVMSGHFAIRWWVKAFMCLWFGFVLLVGLVILTDPRPIGWSRLVAFIMPAGGAAVVLVCKVFGKWEEREIIEFLKKTLDATVVEG